jgi:4-amino-4-deoxy-L-arabinose transferase-like glycosyltransferase
VRSFLTSLTKPSRPFLPAVFLLALALRLAFVLWFHARHPSFVFPDSQQYDIVARNVLEGNGFVLQDDRKAQRPPVYPLFMILCGRSVLAIRVAQAVIGAASCLLVFKLCLLLFDSEPAARLAAIGMAVEPFNTFFTGLALTETLYTAALLAAMLFLARLVRDGPFWPAAAAGALLGFGVLLRPSLFLFPFFLLPFWLVLARPVEAVHGWLLLFACVAVVMAPWTVRNRLVLGAFVPTTTQGGESLWEANNPRADGGPMMDQGIFPENLDKLPEVERDRALGRAARQFIVQNPGRFLALCGRKFLRFWNVLLNFAGYRTPVYNAISFVSTVTVYILALVGLVTAWRANWRPALLCLLPVLYTAGLHLVFVGSVRYRVPVIPYLLCLAAVGLGRWAYSNASRNEN